MTYGTRDIMRILNVSRSTAKRVMASGNFATIQVGKRTRAVVSSFDAWVRGEISTTEVGSRSPAEKEKQVAKKERQPRGDVYQRGKTWTIVLHVPDPKTGRKKRKWIGGFESEAQARRELAWRQADIDRGIIRQVEKITFSQHAEKAMKDLCRNARPNTVLGYRTSLTHARGAFGDMDMASITVDDIVRLDEDLVEKGIVAATRAKYHQRVRAIFKHAENRDLIGKSPYRLFDERRVHEDTSPAVRRMLTPAEVRMLMDEADEPLSTAIEFGYMLGLRRGEVCGLEAGDFDLDAGLVHIRRQGTDQGGTAPLKTPSARRTLVLPPGMLEKARELCEGLKPDDRLLRLPCGRVLKPNWISWRFRRLVRPHGWDTTFHTLRHCFASTLVRSGIDPKEVSESMGHAGTQVTLDTYCHTSGPSKAVAEVMEKALRGSSSLR